MGRLRRGLAMGMSSLVLMLGLATGAAAQTCATTDVAITGVTPAPSDPAALAGDCTTLHIPYRRKVIRDPSIDSPYHF